jgi:hypothetical protein
MVIKQTMIGKPPAKFRVGLVLEPTFSKPDRKLLTTQAGPVRKSVRFSTFPLMEKTFVQVED